MQTKFTRRQFLSSLGSSCLVYAFRFTPGSGTQSIYREPLPAAPEDVECEASILEIDYRDWIIFDEKGNVTIFTGRTELGQGLKTVLVALVTQGLEIPGNKLKVVMGNTDLCPDDGPTTGSCATPQVGWGFWLACEKIREDILGRASNILRVPENDLEFKEGQIIHKNYPEKTITPVELGRGEAVLMTLDPDSFSSAKKNYIDKGIFNINAKRIVTGTLKYAGDVKVAGMLYADWHISPYYPQHSIIKSVDLTEAKTIPGVKMVEVLENRVVASAQRYHDVVKALHNVKVQWETPSRPKELKVEEEIRARAKFAELLEKKGDINFGLNASFKIVSETYQTQYATWAQIETDTALARPEKGGSEFTVWVSSQYPHKKRRLISETLQLSKDKIHILAMPVGGGFGGKTGNPVAQEAASLALYLGQPVKIVYSRKNQFNAKGSYKMACVIDLTTGVSSDGRILARKIDIYQDKRKGTAFVYEVPNVLTRLFEADWPFKRAVSRGTSYVQTCFAVESHVDMVAAAIGFDPFEFRRINVQYPAFVNLIDACAEMIGYTHYQPAPDEGIGLALCHHGGRQLGAVAAEVAVNRRNGKVKIKRICAAFDIGTVINRNTVKVGIRGAITWGIGYALYEKVKLDGHGSQTNFFADYHIPRFSDIPPIEITFLDNLSPGAPRGCGEVPVIPTIGAIANAVHKAIGIRFYSTPITPDKVRKALKNG